MSQPQKIALFGGSFDPIHEGHLEIAQKAIDHLHLDKLIFIPCQRSPHKDKSPGATPAQRLQMLQLATQNLPWAMIDSFEIDNPPPSFTWKTIEHLRQQYPEPTQLYLLIGFDQWEAFPKWSKPDEIARQVEFIVVGRDDQQPKPREGHIAHFIQGNHPASSSQIRNSAQQEAPLPWLHPKVSDFIKIEQLYTPKVPNHRDN